MSDGEQFDVKFTGDTSGAVTALRSLTQQLAAVPRRPKRIQLSRKRGWRKPEGAVVVARPGRWGNPYKVGGLRTRAEAVAAFRSWVLTPGLAHPTLDEIRAELAGKDLACWCPLDQPCHADVLLELANESTS